MKAAVLFMRFGPYHIARLEAAAERMRAVGDELVGIEVSPTDEKNFYLWDRPSGLGFAHVVLERQLDYSALPAWKIRQLVTRELDRIAPDVVFINGWSNAEARAALIWACATGAGRVVMSTSQSFDYRRNVIIECAKGALVSLFDAGFVGGDSHRDYLRQLGIPNGRVALGYNAVDNSYYTTTAAAAGGALLRETTPHFLVVGRLIPEKNLAALLHAYRTYVDTIPSDQRHDLVLAGSGPLEASLRTLVEDLRLSDHVRFLGFIQAHELGRCYSAARAVLLPSVKETWGLVINEAMAAGLPVLVSHRCGCVRHLVREGENGFVVDPFSRESLIDGLRKLSALSEERRLAMGEASKRIVADWGLERFAEGFAEAAHIALERRRARRGLQGMSAR